MFEKNNYRDFFEDVADFLKGCCEKYSIDIEEKLEEFDDFLDEIDREFTSFLDSLNDDEN